MRKELFCERLRLCIPSSEAPLMAIPRNKLFHHFLLARCRRLSFLQPSPSISLFYFLQNLSTLVPANNTHGSAHFPYPNPFAEFAATKFNLSSADIARMFKANPALERLKTLKEVEEFADMLKRYGCTQLQIAFIMKRLPTSLSGCPEKVIEPKILLLKVLGIQGKDLAKVVTRRPGILRASLQSTLIPNAAFLQDTFKTRDLFSRAILRLPSILTYDLEKYLKPSVAFFEECGLVGEQLCKLILIQPALLLCNCLTPAKADFLQKIGVDRGCKMYKYILAMVAVSRLETLEAKMENLQQCGFTAEETMELFRLHHVVFGFSQERVRQNMDFVINDMKLPANSVFKWPCLLKCNLKVLKPRVLVLKRIQTLNNLGHLEMRGLSSILAMSEGKFVDKIIKGHAESRLLNEVYQEALTDALATTKAGTQCSKRMLCY